MVDAAASLALASPRRRASLPPLPLAPMEGVFRDGMDEVYAGAIEIAVDGTFVSLPSGTDDIEIESP